MRKLSDEEKSLEAKYIQNPIKFSIAKEYLWVLSVSYHIFLKL